MSCFNATGELLNQGLSLTTVNRYANDLIIEFRGITQKGKPSPQKETKKANPIKKRFTFRQGQVLFDGHDLNVGTGAAPDIAKTLVENFGYVVPFQKLDENSSKKEASEKIRTVIKRLRKIIKSAKVPIVIENRKAEGYLMLPLTT